MATINDPWPKKSFPNGHPADGMTLQVDVGGGARMTIADPRSADDGGLAWNLRFGAVNRVRHSAASALDSYDYLLSSEIGVTEAIRRLRECVAFAPRLPLSPTPNPSEDQTMSEMMTTPGPWRVEEDIRDGVMRSEKPELVGYNITSDAGEVVGMEGLLADKKGDAYLIASAPTMLSVLRAMDEALTKDWGEPRHYATNTNTKLGSAGAEAWSQIRSVLSRVDAR